MTITFGKVPNGLIPPVLKFSEEAVANRVGRPTGLFFGGVRQPGPRLCPRGSSEVFCKGVCLDLPNTIVRPVHDDTKHEAGSGYVHPLCRCVSCRAGTVRRLGGKQNVSLAALESNGVWEQGIGEASEWA
jgi:hypothetical protein